MCRQVILYRLAVGRQLAVDDQLLQLLLDPAHLGSREDAADAHDLFARDQRRQPGGVLDAVRAEHPSRLAPLITGEGIMRIRGILPGPEVGRIKQKLEELVIDGELPPDSQAVKDYLATHPQL